MILDPDSQCPERHGHASIPIGKERRHCMHPGQNIMIGHATPYVVDRCCLCGGYRHVMFLPEPDKAHGDFQPRRYTSSDGRVFVEAISEG